MNMDKAPSWNSEEDDDSDYGYEVPKKPEPPKQEATPLFQKRQEFFSGFLSERIGKKLFETKDDEESEEKQSAEQSPDNEEVSSTVVETPVSSEPNVAPSSEDTLPSEPEAFVESVANEDVTPKPEAEAFVEPVEEPLSGIERVDSIDPIKEYAPISAPSEAESKTAPPQLGEEVLSPEATSAIDIEPTEKAPESPPSVIETSFGGGNIVTPASSAHVETAAPRVEREIVRESPAAAIVAFLGADLLSRGRDKKLDRKIEKNQKKSEKQLAEAAKKAQLSQDEVERRLKEHQRVEIQNSSRTNLLDGLKVTQQNTENHLHSSDQISHAEQVNIQAQEAFLAPVIAAIESRQSGPQMSELTFDTLEATNQEVVSQRDTHETEVLPVGPELLDGQVKADRLEITETPVYPEINPQSVPEILASRAQDFEKLDKDAKKQKTSLLKQAGPVGSFDAGYSDQSYFLGNGGDLVHQNMPEKDSNPETLAQRTYKQSVGYGVAIAIFLLILAFIAYSLA